MRFSCIPFLIVLTSLSFVACNDDNDSWAPNYQMDFMEILTDAQGQGSKAVMDNGDTLKTLNTIRNLTPDSVYRYIAVYTREVGGLRFSSVAQTLSPPPFTKGNHTMKTDAVKVQSIWRGGNYINITLNILSKDFGHIFGFEETELEEQTDHKNLHLTLFHDDKNDTQAYTRTVYLSCPLYKYANKMEHKRDSIYFTVNDYNNGETTYPLVY